MPEEILSQETTLERIARWNMQGLNISFHPDGHITCWEDAWDVEDHFPLFSADTFEEFTVRVESYIREENLQGD